MTKPTRKEFSLYTLVDSNGSGDNDNSLLIRRVFDECLEHLAEFSYLDRCLAMSSFGCGLSVLHLRFGINPNISTFEEYAATPCRHPLGDGSFKYSLSAGFRPFANSVLSFKQAIPFINWETSLHSPARTHSSWEFAVTLLICWRQFFLPQDRTSGSVKQLHAITL